MTKWTTQRHGDRPITAADGVAELIPTDPDDPDRPQPQPPTQPPRPQPPRPRPPRPQPPRPRPPTIPDEPDRNDPGDPGDSERVVLLPDYFPDGMLGRLDDVVTALDKAIVRINPAAVASGPGVEVNNARKRMSAFLKSAAFSTGRDALLGVDEESLGFVTAMIRRELDIALAEVRRIEGIRPPSGVSGLSEATINTALKTTPTEYTIDLPIGPPIRQTLPGYSGQTLTTTQRFRLSDFSELVAGGQEREFRLPLLRAECLAGQRDYRNAFFLYRALLDGGRLSSARTRFVAVRAGYALVDRADQVYRSMLRFDVSKRKLARVDYTEAVKVLDDHGVPSNDPDRATIAARALRGRTMLHAGFNPLGLRDSFVPVQRYSHLLNEATLAIQSCLATANAFEDDLSRAEAELGARFDVEAERRAEATLGEITALQVANATLTEEQMDEKIAMIEAQQDFLVLESAIAGAGKLVEAAATAGFGTEPPTDPFAGGPGVAGFASTVAHFFAERNELQHQLAMAEIEREIAANQTAIAGLQQQLSADRLAHLERKAAFLQDKRMNAEFLFERAAVRERRAERQLDVAIFLAYLSERALAFFLGKPNVKHIRFDYRDTEPGVVAAAEALKEAFENMQFVEEAALDQEQIGNFVERLSLIENYPLQFQQFLESDDGRMDFVYSLYQLSKDRPATHQCRLYAVGVEVKGLVPEGELRGTLSHSGRFLVRDSDVHPRSGDDAARADGRADRAGARRPAGPGNRRRRRRGGPDLRPAGARRARPQPRLATAAPSAADVHAEHVRGTRADRPVVAAGRESPQLPDHRRRAALRHHQPPVRPGRVADASARARRRLRGRTDGGRPTRPRRRVLAAQRSSPTPSSPSRTARRRSRSTPRCSAPT